MMRRAHTGEVPQPGHGRWARPGGGGRRGAAPRAAAPSSAEAKKSSRITQAATASERGAGPVRQRQSASRDEKRSSQSTRGIAGAAAASASAKRRVAAHREALGAVLLERQADDVRRDALAPRDLQQPGHDRVDVLVVLDDLERPAREADAHGTLSIAPPARSPRPASAARSRSGAAPAAGRRRRGSRRAASGASSLGERLYYECKRCSRRASYSVLINMPLCRCYARCRLVQPYSA